MREIRKAVRFETKGQRRWFNSPAGDLFVWEKQGRVYAFEYSYDKPHNEHLLSWSEHSGFGHMRVDDGEANPFHNQSPLLVTEPSVADMDYISHHFGDHALEIDSSVFLFVLGKIDEISSG